MVAVNIGNTVYVRFHGWKNPSWKTVDIPVDFRETTICIGFFTVDYERFI